MLGNRFFKINLILQLLILKISYKLLTIVKKLKKIVGIGELLFDILPTSKKVGGAPCNFVYHASCGGELSYVISAVGNDEDGREILKLLKKKKLETQFIQVNQKPTSTVDVVLNATGIPDYTIKENVAWDFIGYNKQNLTIIDQADILYFGTLAQRNNFSRNTILKLVKHCKSNALIVYDINIRKKYYSKQIITASLKLCNVLKLNEEELQVLQKLGIVGQGNEEELLNSIIKNYNLKLVALTKGEIGSWLMTPLEKSFMASPKVTVKDTVGAGDAFTAAMIRYFANGEPLETVHRHAVEVSAYVCTQDGAMPEYNPHFHL